MATTISVPQGWSCLAFVGWHDSGKTTLLRAVARILSSRGRRVAVLKSTKHRAEELFPHRPGSDTALFLDDGLRDVAVAASDGVVLETERGPLPASQLAFRLFPDAEVVLAEGFKGDASIPKIAVMHPGAPREHGTLEELLAAAENVVAVAADPATASGAVEGLPILDPADPEAVASFVEELIIPQVEEAVTLWADGREIPLNRFVKAALQGTLKGFIGSLRGTEGVKEAVIRVRLR